MKTVIFTASILFLLKFQVQQKKNAEDVQKKQKKLPVKITDKTRFSALITDDPSAPSVSLNSNSNLPALKLSSFHPSEEDRGTDL